MSGYENAQTEEVETAVDAPVEERVLSSVARVRLSRQKCRQVGACNLYEISDGWEKKVLLQDELVSKVYTTRDLERALRHPDQEIILVPRQAGINLAALETVCNRNSLGKTIYYESA